MPLTCRLSTLAVVAAVGLSAEFGAAQSPSEPPTALPLHSALPEDARDYGQLPPSAPSSSRLTASAALLPPPASDAPDFVPVPPLATPQPAGPTFGPEPPPAPWFSWTPTYVPPDAKSGMLQQALFRTTYLPRFGGGDGFGLTDVTQQMMLAVPPFIAGSPVLIAPSASVHFLDGPTGVDLPAEVYSFELEFRYMKQVTSRFGFDLAVAPSYFGDLHNDSGDAWRVTARALAAWDWTPAIKLVAGGLVLGRSDYPAIPVGGVIWKPTPDWRLDVVFPRPRVYRRIGVHGDVEQHVYLGGELGGNTWAIDRTGGVADKFTYGDLRMVLGWERTVPRGLNGRVELGWVFDRKIEFQSGLPDFRPDDTLLVRGELSY